MTDEMATGRVVALTLEDVEARAEGMGLRACRWPACPLPARRLSERGTVAAEDACDPPRSGAVGRPSRGRRPEYCSDDHRRRTGDTVRALRSLFAEARELRDAATGRERRRADVVVADLVHRLALHGEPCPPEPSAEGTARQPPDRARLVALPALPAQAALAGKPPEAVPDEGGGGTVVDLDSRRPAGRGWPVPVLGLRRSATRAEFHESWLRLRDAADAARAVVAALRRADGADRARLGAAMHLELADLAQAADQVLLDLVLLPDAAGNASSGRP